MDSSRARTRRDQRQAAGVALFFKQWGRPVRTQAGHLLEHGPGMGSVTHPSSRGVMRHVPDVSLE
jgi:hypothetical protein